jgi:hypothetical protein
MKKLIALFALIFLIFSFSISYADTVSYKRGKLDNNGIRTHRWKCLDTDANGNVTCTTSNPISGFIVGVRFMPDDNGDLVLTGDNQPITNWDVSMDDQLGQDIIMGLGTDIPNVYTGDYTLYRTPITRDDSSNNVSLIYISGARITPAVSGLGANNGAVVELYVKEQGSVRGRP